MLETLPNSNGKPVGLWRQSAGKTRYSARTLRDYTPCPTFVGEDIVRSLRRRRGYNSCIVTTSGCLNLKVKIFRIYFGKFCLLKEKSSEALRKTNRFVSILSEVLTRTNGVIIWVLSRRRARWKCIDGKDAVCPQQDEKTPCSFTTAWHWIEL